MPRARFTGTTEERFWARIIIMPNGCWGWGAAKNNRGYGKLGVGGKMVYAHRLSYEMFIGPIADGLELDHLCRNPQCSNPLHLEAVTHAENVRRGMAGPTGAAYNIAKTHCPRGHEYAGANLHVTRNGSRQCRLCRKLGQRERRALMRDQGFVKGE